MSSAQIKTAYHRRGYRYKRTIYAWDVVNEVIEDNNSKFYRESTRYQICGDEFIARAFECSHKADPDAF